MRDWRTYWRETQTGFAATPNDALVQVGKTTMGEPIERKHVETILNTIGNRLALTTSDVVLDLGCGNGLLTVEIAKQVEQIAGIDVSETLIATANAVNAHSNCSYHIGDLAELSQLPIGEVTKAYSYEVFQHLTGAETKLLLHALLELFDHGLVFFVGSLPEQSKLRSFYDTSERWTLYEQNAKVGDDQIGHWWDREELVEICVSLGLNCSLFDQSESLYTSHYRFDATITSL